MTGRRFMVEIPALLVERIRARQAVLVSGLGPSSLAGAPRWFELLSRLIAKLRGPGESERDAGEKLLASGRYADALMLVRRRLARAEIAAEIADEIAQRLSTPVSIPDSVQRVAALPWRATVVTSFDDLWERALTDVHGEGAVRVLFGSKAEAAASSGPPGGGRALLVQLCGRAGEPDTLCLGPADLRERLIPSGAWGQLVNIARRRSLVFVGFAPNDPDLLLLESLLAPIGFASSPDFDGTVESPPHFVFLETAAKLEGLLLEERLGIHPLYCERGVVEAFDAIADAAGAAEFFGDPGRSPSDEVTTWLDALARDPSDPQATAALDSATAALRLDEDWPALANLLSARAARLSGRREGLALYREAAEVFRTRLRDAESAIAALEAALRAFPGDADAGEELSDLLRRRERWGELAAHLAETANQTRDPIRAVEHLIESATICERQLGNFGGAIAAYRRVLEIDSESEAAFAALERIYTQQERWVDLAGLFETRAKRLPPVDAVNELRRSAEILARQAANPKAASAALEQALAIDPSNRDVLRALEHVYEESGDEEKYLAILDRLVEVAPDDAERALVLRRIAAEWEAWPEGLDRAADALEQVLCIHPGDREALRALARLYRAARRPLALADVVARQIESADSDEEKRELYLGLAAICDAELGDAARGAEAYAAAEALGESGDAMFEALSRLYEKLGRWPACVATLERWATATADGDRRAEALFRAGTLLAKRLDDVAGAEERLARVLEVVPDHVGALTALGEISRARGDRTRAADLMAQAAKRAVHRAEQTRLLYEAALLHAEAEPSAGPTTARGDQQPSDDERAIELLLGVLAIDPEHVASAERLLGIYERRQQWAAMEPLLDMLAEHLDHAQPARAAEILVRRGQIAQRNGHHPKALASFAAAFELQPERLPVLLGYANARMDNGDWADARGLLQAALRVHRASLGPRDVAQIYERLARCEEEEGDSAGAIGWLEKALAIEPQRRGALESIAGLHEKSADWAAVVVAKRALVDSEGPAGRARIFEEIGDIYRERIGNLAQATAAYQAALEADPARASVLRRLLDIYSAAKRWPGVATVLAMLAELETEPAVRARYFHTAALVRRDELGDGAGAVPLFERALDEAPSMQQAWDDLEALLEGRQAWRELAESTQRMLKRLETRVASEERHEAKPAIDVEVDDDEDTTGADAEMNGADGDAGAQRRAEADAQDALRLRLWQRLGTVALEHLRDTRLAITAFQNVVRLAPGDIPAREKLAALYTDAGAPYLEHAIAAHQMLIADNPDRLSSYRALVRLYALTGAADQRFCVAATLTFLRKADPEIEAFWARHQPRHMPKAEGEIDDEMWTHLVHPDEDPLVTAVLAVAGPIVAASRAQSHASVGLRRKDRADLGGNGKPALRTLAYLSEALDMSPPDVFVRDADGAESTGATVIAIQEKGVLRPIVVLSSTLAGQRSESQPDLVFELAMTLALLRPERVARQALSSPVVLGQVLRAALVLGGGSTAHAKDAAEIERIVAVLRKNVPRSIMPELAALAERLRSERGDAIDIRRWVGGTDLTAARVALLLCGDLRAAARVLSADRLWSSPLSAKQRLKDLLSFSVSDAYFFCRRRLGFSVG